MSVHVSTSAFPNRRLEEIVPLAMANGFDIELGSSLEHSAGFRECLDRARGAIRFLVHNYFPPPAEPFVLNLASADPSLRRQSLALCTESIDLCAELESPFYSLHAGFAIDLAPGELGRAWMQRRPEGVAPGARAEAYDRFLAAVRELALHASRKGVGLLVENNVVARENVNPGERSPFLLADVEEILRFFEDVNDAHVGLLLDAGHAKVSSATLGDRPERYFERLSPFIRALHLSDNDGLRDEHRPFGREAWFAQFLKRHASVPMVLEVNRLTIGEMTGQRRILQEMLA